MSHTKRLVDMGNGTIIFNDEKRVNPWVHFPTGRGRFFVIEKGVDGSGLGYAMRCEFASIVTI